MFAPGPLSRRTLDMGQDTGVRHVVSEGGATVAVFVFDLKNDRRADRDQFLAPFLGVSADRLTRRGVRPIFGGDATEYAAKVGGYDHAVLVIGRQGLWFVFHLKQKPEDDPRDARRSAFLTKAGVSWVRAGQRLDPISSEPAKVKPTPNR
ncbi:MAG: hypothetical protein MUF18_07285 [Fimbriiglobus sp.]|nr:hypothetical protein [Fimbriiglobus sp.]